VVLFIYARPSYVYIFIAFSPFKSDLYFGFQFKSLLEQVCHATCLPLTLDLLGYISLKNTLFKILNVVLKQVFINKT